jgi:hypothetical protein
MSEPGDAVLEVKKVFLLNQDGQASHVRSKMLVLTQTQLRIGGKGEPDIDVPLDTVIDTECSRNRVAVTYTDGSGEVSGFALSVSGFGGRRRAGELKLQIDKLRSICRLEARRKKLEAEGRAGELTVVECRFCGTPIDMTDFPGAAQIHCEFCKSIFSADKESAHRLEKNHYFCDCCRYYSHIQEYSTLKLIFIIWYAQWSVHNEKLCPTCARARARNRAIYCFFLSTFALIAAVPYNLVAYFKALRAHKQVPDPIFARLDEANRLARRRRFKEAQGIYIEIAKNSLTHMGIVTNMGIVLHEQGEGDGAISAVEKAVGLCPNYLGNHLLLAALHREAGREAEAAEIEGRAEKLWEIDEPAVEAPAPEQGPEPPAPSE